LLFTPNSSNPAPARKVAPRAVAQAPVSQEVSTVQTEVAQSASVVKPSFANILNEVQAEPQEPAVVAEPIIETVSEVAPIIEETIVEQPMIAETVVEEDVVPPWIDAEMNESAPMMMEETPVEVESVAVMTESQSSMTLNNNEEWLEIVRNLDIIGLSLGIVRNLVFDAFQDNVLTLKRSLSDHAFNIPDAEKNIADAVGIALNQSIQCRILAVETEMVEDDFNHRADKELQAKKVNALAQIKNEPVVQLLVNECQATVIDSTLMLADE